MTLDWITQHPTEALAALLATTTTIAIGIRGAIPLLSKLAEHTATRADDDFLARLAPKIDALIATLDVLRRLMPRVVVGPLPSTQPIASATGRVTVPSLSPPVKPLSAPPGPATTLRPWPAPAEDVRVVTPIELPGDDKSKEPKA